MLVVETSVVVPPTPPPPPPPPPVIDLSQVKEEATIEPCPIPSEPIVEVDPEVEMPINDLLPEGGNGQSSGESSRSTSRTNSETKSDQIKVIPRCRMFL